MCEWYMCVHTPCACPMPVETRRGHRIIRNWSFRWLWATSWVLGPEPASSGRAANALTTELSLQPWVRRETTSQASLSQGRRTLQLFCSCSLGAVPVKLVRSNRVCRQRTTDLNPHTITGTGHAIIGRCVTTDLNSHTTSQVRGMPS